MRAMRPVLRQSLVWSAVLVVAWIVATCDTFVEVDQSWRSFALSAGSMSSVIIILTPLACAAGCAFGAHLKRSGAIRMSSAWPHRTAATIVTWWIVGAGVVLLATALLADAILAWTCLAGGCHPDPRLAAGPVVTAMATTASLAVGALVGVATGSYLCAAVAGIGLYVVACEWPPFETVMMGWYGPVALDGSANHPSLQTYLVYGVLQLVVIAAVLVVIALLTATRGDRPWWMWATAALLVGAIVGGVTATLRLDPAWEPTDRWDCRTVGDRGSMACVPLDVEWRADEYVEATDRADRFLEDMGVQEPILYSGPGAPGYASAHRHYVFVGAVSTDAPRSQWADSLAGALLNGEVVLPKDPHHQKPTEQWCVDNFLTSHHLFEAVMDGTPPDPAETLTFLTMDKQCLQ